MRALRIAPSLLSAAGLHHRGCAGSLLKAQFAMRRLPLRANRFADLFAGSRAQIAARRHLPWSNVLLRGAAHKKGVI